jgi:hypothetical protein
LINEPFKLSTSLVKDCDRFSGKENKGENKCDTSTHTFIPEPPQMNVASMVLVGDGHRHNPRVDLTAQIVSVARLQGC